MFSSSISQKDSTHVWKIYEIPLKIFVFPNFEGVKDEKVFFVRAEINPYDIQTSVSHPAAVVEGWRERASPGGDGSFVI